MPFHAGRTSAYGWRARMPLWVGTVFESQHHPVHTRRLSGLIVNARRRAFYVFWSSE